MTPFDETGISSNIDSVVTKPNEHSKTFDAIIIGAGIAGCASAYSLATRGWQVTLIDKHKHVADGASGNAQGVLYAKLASDMNLQSEFYLAGYLYSLQLLKHVMPDKKNWDNCGVLQLAFSEKEHKRQQQGRPLGDRPDQVRGHECRLVVYPERA